MEQTTNSLPSTGGTTGTTELTARLPPTMGMGTGKTPSVHTPVTGSKMFSVKNPNEMLSPRTRLPATIVKTLDSLIFRLINCSPSTVFDKTFHFEELREICLRARELLLSEPVFLKVSPPIFILGDLHGQLFDLQKMMALCGGVPKHKFLFLGDYVDRGAHSIETVSLLLTLKLRYSRNVYLLRGNHETRCVNRQYGFYDECQRKFPGRGVELWTLYQHVFNCLPFAARVGDRLFCAHGGISEDLCTFKQFERVVRPTDVCDIGLLCDLIWSDPSPTTATFAPSPRGVSSVFGKQAIIDFCSQLNVDLIVRAHQCVMDGYEMFADRRCITIFSAPCYCGEVDNAAGILHVGRHLECQVLTYRSDRMIKGGKMPPSASPKRSAPSGGGSAEGRKKEQSQDK